MGAPTHSDSGKQKLARGWHTSPKTSEPLFSFVNVQYGNVIIEHRKTHSPQQAASSCASAPLIAPTPWRCPCPLASSLRRIPHAAASTARSGSRPIGRQQATCDDADGAARQPTLLTDLHTHHASARETRLPRGRMTPPLLLLLHSIRQPRAPALISLPANLRPEHMVGEGIGV